MGFGGNSPSPSYNAYSDLGDRVSTPVEDVESWLVLPDMQGSEMATAASHMTPTALRQVGGEETSSENAQAQSETFCKLPSPTELGGNLRANDAKFRVFAETFVLPILNAYAGLQGKGEINWFDVKIPHKGVLCTFRILVLYMKRGQFPNREQAKQFLEEGNGMVIVDRESTPASPAAYFEAKEGNTIQNPGGEQSAPVKPFKGGMLHRKGAAFEAEPGEYEKIKTWICNKVRENPSREGPQARRGEAALDDVEGGDEEEVDEEDCENDGAETRAAGCTSKKRKVELPAEKVPEKETDFSLLYWVYISVKDEVSNKQEKEKSSGGAAESQAASSAPCENRAEKRKACEAFVQECAPILKNIMVSYSHQTCL